MSDKAPVTLMRPHAWGETSVSPAPSEVLGQVATSPEPGAVTPQLAPAVRSVPVAALVAAMAGTKHSQARANEAAKPRSQWWRGRLVVVVFICVIGYWLVVFGRRLAVGGGSYWLLVGDVERVFHGYSGGGFGYGYESHTE